MLYFSSLADFGKWLTAQADAAENKARTAKRLEDVRFHRGEESGYRQLAALIEQGLCHIEPLELVIKYEDGLVTGHQIENRLSVFPMQRQGQPLITELVVLPRPLTLSVTDKHRIIYPSPSTTQEPTHANHHP